MNTSRFGGFIACLTLLCGTVQSASAQPGAAPTTVKDRASYAFGLDIGRRLRQEVPDVQPDLLVRGLLEGLGGKQAALTDQELTDAITEFNKQRFERIKAEGETFLANNKKVKGVVVLASGLQYQVLKTGTGPSPKVTDKVKVHYEGTFVNGTIFDSSRQRNMPAEFAVRGVIPGWVEALPLMKVGDKWKLFVPSTLAYGPRGFGDIPPNATLVFEIELLAIEPSEALPPKPTK